MTSRWNKDNVYIIPKGKAVWGVKPAKRAGDSPGAVLIEEFESTAQVIYAWKDIVGPDKALNHRDLISATESYRYFEKKFKHEYMVFRIPENDRGYIFVAVYLGDVIQIEKGQFLTEEKVWDIERQYLKGQFMEWTS